MATYLLCCLLLRNTIPSHNLPLYLGGYIFMFAPYTALLWQERSGGGAAIDTRALFGVYLLGRLALWSQTPVLSDDIYRYLWEGRVVASGQNPYLLAPLAAQLTPLRDQIIWPRINHPQIPTIYPPLFLYLSALTSVIGSQMLAYKAAVLSCDLALLAALRGLSGSTRKALLCYGLSPLFLLEFVIGGHNDIFAITAMAAALLCWQRYEEGGSAFFSRHGRLLSALFWAAGISLKLLPALILPYFYYRKRPGLAWIALVGGAVFISYLPFLGDPVALVTALGIYTRSWSFNSVFHSGLLALGASEPQVRLLGLGLLLGSYLYLTFRPQLSLPQFALGIYTAAFLLSATCHPWYWAWALAFVAFTSRPRALILLSATLVLAYRVLPAYWASGDWSPQPVTLIYVYLPPLLLWIYDNRPAAAHWDESSLKMK